MSNFWQYESTDTYNAKKAQDWADNARQQAMDLVGQGHQDAQGADPSLTPLPNGNMFDTSTPNITTPDMKSVYSGYRPDSKKSSSLLGDIVNPVIHFGEDVLHPFLRAMELENQYVARPIARTLLSPVDHGNYDDLPPLLRNSVEILADPLTYLGPGAIGKVFKLARLAPEMQLAAPTLEALFASPGSKKALFSVAEKAGIGLAGVFGAEGAKQLGLPPILGAVGGNILAGRGFQALQRPIDLADLNPNMPMSIVVDNGQVLYHGTRANYEGMPSLRPPERTYKSNSAPWTIYLSKYPQVADYNATEFGSSTQGLRTFPMVMKPGVKIWKFGIEPPPAGLPENLLQEVEKATNKGANYLGVAGQYSWHDVYAAAEDAGKNYAQDTSHLPPMPSNIDPELVWGSHPTKKYLTNSSVPDVSILDMLPSTAKDELVINLRRLGYSGIETPSEYNIFNRGALVSKYTGEQLNHIISSMVDPSKDLRFQAANKAEEETLSRAWGKPNTGLATMRMNQQLRDSETLTSIKAKLDDGTATEDDLHRAELLVARLEKQGKISSSQSSAAVERIRSQAGISKQVEPPVQPGYVRLYRGQTGEYAPSVDQIPGQGFAQAGRSFTTNKDTASFYAGSKGHIRYVDVPDSIMSDSWEQKRLGAGGLPSEHVLPAEWANKARPLEPTPNAFNEPGSAQGTGHGPGTPKAQDPITEINNQLSYQNASAFSVRDRASADQHARDTVSYTQQGRAILGDVLQKSPVGKKLESWLTTNGIRLHDSPVTAALNEHGRFNALGMNAASALGDQLDITLQRGGIPVSEITNKGTIVTDQNLITQAKNLQVTHPEWALLDPQGNLHIDNLLLHHPDFVLTPQQQATIDAVMAPISQLHDIASAFGIDMPKFKNDDGGYNVHRQRLTEQVPNMAGETISIPSGPVISNRYGSNQSQVITQTEPSIAAGIANGNTYLPFVESQRAFAQQSYRRMADEVLSRNIEEFGQSAVDLLPDNIVNEVTRLNKIAYNATRLDSEIGRIIHINEVRGSRGAWLGPKWKTTPPELQPVVDAMALADQQGVKAVRLQQMKDARSLLTQITEQNTAALEPMKEARASMIKDIKTNPSSRGSFPTEFKGKYYPYEIGQELKPLQQTNTPDGITAQVNRVNNTIRPIMATLDVSFMGVQGLVAALSNPIAYGKALTTLFSGGYADYYNSIKDSGRLDLMLQSGVHWAARNDFNEFMLPHVINKVPGVAQSNSGFTRFGNIMRSELFNAGLPTATTDIARETLARSVNLLTGFSPNSPTQLESALLFAPRFMRSQLGLIADAVSKHQMTPSGAARSLGTFIASGTGLTYTINKMLGNETDTDPTSSNFMRIRFGGQDFSIFGTWDTLVRAMTLTYTKGPKDAGLYLARGKSSPVIGRMWDLLSGETMQGESLDMSSPGQMLESAGKLALASSPIALQNALQQAPKITSPEDALGIGIDFLGPKSTPLSPSENMAITRDNLAQTKYNKPWSQLEPFQQDQLRSDNNVDLPDKTAIDRAFTYRGAISTRFNDAQQKLDDTMPIGQDWIKAKQNLDHERVGAYAQWAAENPEALAQITSAKPKNALEAKRQEFYNLFVTADKQKWSSDQLTQAISDFQDSLSTDQASYIERNTGFKDTARVKEYKADQKVLAPYWQLADELWTRMSSKIPGGTTATSLQDYTDQLIQTMQDNGIPDSAIVTRIQHDPLLQRIQQAQTTLREQYRRAHPEADKLLTKWYGRAPIASRAA